MGTTVVTAAFATALLLASAANAEQVFKCTDRQGRITYTNSACPGNSAQAHDISNAVQVCADEECERRRQQDLELALQRLREDKMALAEMTAQRHKAEAEYRERMTRLQDLRAQQAASERIAINEPYYEPWGYGWGYGWLAPGYPVTRPPQKHPGAKPQHPAHRAAPHRSPGSAAQVR